MVWIRVGQRGWGNGYGGYRPRYGGGGGGGCLRDLLLLDAGCCLAETLGCGGQLVLLSPAVARLWLHAAPSGRGSRASAAVRLYQQRISARRTHPCCRMSPSCSNYALGALEAHGTARGLRLTAARLLRCRPGGATGADPVPGAQPSR